MGTPPNGTVQRMVSTPPPSRRRHQRHSYSEQRTEDGEGGDVARWGEEPHPAGRRCQPANRKPPADRRPMPSPRWHRQQRIEQSDANEAQWPPPPRRQRERAQRPSPQCRPEPRPPGPPIHHPIVAGQLRSRPCSPETTEGGIGPAWWRSALTGALRAVDTRKAVPAADWDATAPLLGLPATELGTEVVDWACDLHERRRRLGAASSACVGCVVR
jgi:hypothetical protein